MFNEGADKMAREKFSWGLRVGEGRERGFQAQASILERWSLEWSWNSTVNVLPGYNSSKQLEQVLCTCVFRRAMKITPRQSMTLWIEPTVQIPWPVHSKSSSLLSPHSTLICPFTWLIPGKTSSVSSCVPLWYWACSKWLNWKGEPK